MSNNSNLNLNKIQSHIHTHTQQSIYIHTTYVCMYMLTNILIL